MSARILIVDDHDVVRQGVSSILSEGSDWEICGAVGSGEEAIQAAATLKPDLVILDITMPGMSGLEAASRIVAFAPGTRILIFTMHESRLLADNIREAGAHGYVQKSQAARDLVIAVERLLSGDTFFGLASSAQPKRKKASNSAAHGRSYCTALCFP
jgi:DNA-binding NarL/FixJ family response regulator